MEKSGAVSCDRKRRLEEGSLRLPKGRIARFGKQWRSSKGCRKQKMSHARAERVGLSLFPDYLPQGISFRAEDYPRLKKAERKG